MGVSFGKSRVADLAFQVYGRVLHPDWFAVRAHRRFAQAGWEADIRIIEGGHAIIWSAATVRLCEILAGPETLLPQAGILFRSSVRHERAAALRPGCGAEYQACFEVERIDPEVFAHLNEELTLDASKGGLFHCFATSNRMATSPISHLQVESRPHRLLIQAFHTFPEEQAIVRTQSLYELGAGKGR